VFSPFLLKSEPLEIVQREQTGSMAIRQILKTYGGKQDLVSIGLSVFEGSINRSQTKSGGKSYPGQKETFRQDFTKAGKVFYERATIGAAFKPKNCLKLRLPK
jgi:hypothetical protein